MACSADTLSQKSTYTLHVAGLTRTLPIVEVAKNLKIASFVILGDTELVVHAAQALAEKLPHDIDYLMTAEAKGIPLAHELSRILNHPRYIVARKSHKAYMTNPISASVDSITTQKHQTLYLDSGDCKDIKGARVVIIDDVISTGESVEGVELLAKKAGAHITARAAILAEGDAYLRKDIIYLEKLPLFTN